MTASAIIVFDSSRPQHQLENEVRANSVRTNAVQNGTFFRARANARRQSQASFRRMRSLLAAACILPNGSFTPVGTDGKRL
jgi:tryptophanyl-tRNA synthetase